MAENVVPDREKPIFAPRRTFVQRLVRTLVVLVALVALYAAGGFFGVPALVKWQLPKHLGELLGREVTLADASFNPFTLEARLEGFVVRDASGPKPLFAFESLYVNASARSITERGAVIDAIRLVRPEAGIVRLDANSYNFSDILGRLTTRSDTPAPDNTPPPRFAIGNLELVDGAVDFDDRPEHVNHTVRALTLAIPFISNFPVYVETRVEPRFAATVNGDPVEVSGESRPFKDTHETLMRVVLKDVDLPRYLEYVPAELDFRMPSAKLDAALNVRFSQPAARPAEMSVDGTARLGTLALTDRTGAPLVAISALDVAIERFDLAANTLALSRVLVDTPVVEVHRDPGGRLNLEHLNPRFRNAAGPAPARPTPDRPFGLIIKAVELRGGAVGFVDETNARPFRTRLQGIEATISDLTLAAGSPARYTLRLATDLGASASASGDFTLSPPAASARVEVSGARVADFAPWYEGLLTVDLVEGVLGAAADLRLAIRDGQPHLQIQGGSANLQGLRASQRSDRQDLVRAGRIALTGIDLDLAASTIALADVQAADVRVLVQRAADGSLNLARVVPSDPARPAGPATASGSAWKYVVKRVALERGAVRFTDATVKPAADLAIEPLQLSIGNITADGGARSPVQFSARVNRAGSVAGSGHVVLDPLAGELNLDISELGIPQFEPYFAGFVNLATASGAVGTRGRLTFAMPDAGAPAVRYSGDVTVSNVATTDRARGEDLLKWRSLYLGQVSFDSAPLAVQLGEIALTDFFARIVLDAGGRLNLQDLLAARAATSGKPDDPASTAAPGSPQPPGAVSNAPDFRIGRVTLQEGTIAFSDFFVKPNYSANLTQITGAVSAITAARAGDVDVRGRINNTGTLEIAGQVNPLAQNLYLDLKAAARDIDLPAMTPYSAKYVGYGIEKGKLSLNVSYRLENNALAAENNLSLDQLTFGEKVDSPDAPNLPVQLAVALLKDRNGVIDINLPISGSLDDPQFSIGGIIARLLVNLIVKAVTSPFALLASAFGSSGSDELGFLEFDAGDARVGAASEEKLRVLARALQDRPALRLDISGRVDPSVDREALRRARLQERVRAEKIRLTASQNASTPSASVTLDAGEYPKWLTALYRNAAFDRPRNVIGMLREQPVAEMERMLLEHTPVNDDDLRGLANSRAQIAKDFLVERGGIGAERIFLVAPRTGTDDLREKGDQGRPTRADFALR